MPRESRISGKSVNRAELAVMLGVARTTIDNWRESGLPFEKQGKSTVFNTREVFEWWQNRLKTEFLKQTDNLTDGDVTRRTMVAEMEIKEAAAAKVTGDAVSIDEFRKAEGDLVATIRSKVLAFAPRYAPEIAQQVVDLVDPDAESEILEEARQLAEAALRRASSEVLSELAEGFEDDSTGEPEELAA